MLLAGSASFSSLLLSASTPSVKHHRRCLVCLITRSPCPLHCVPNTPHYPTIRPRHTSPHPQTCGHTFLSHGTLIPVQSLAPRSSLRSRLLLSDSFLGRETPRWLDGSEIVFCVRYPLLDVPPRAAPSLHHPAQHIWLTAMRFLSIYILSASFHSRMFAVRSFIRHRQW